MSLNNKTLVIAGAAGAAGLMAGLAISRVCARRDVSRILRSNASLASSQQTRSLVTCLTAHGHGHLFRHWAPAGINDAAKQRLLSTVAAAVEQATSQPEVEQARQAALQAPAAERRPKTLTTHGRKREDPYYWLRDDERKDPAVIAHLEAETAYAKAALADTEALQEALYKEMRGRIQESDQSTPQRHNDYFYYSRTVEGGQYRINCRRRVPPGAGPPSENDMLDDGSPEEVLLDENAQAEKHSFYMVGGFEVSPDHSLLAYAVDTVGGEKFTLHVVDLASGKEVLSPLIEGTAGNLTWANDNKTLFYVTKDKLDRPYKVWKYTLGSAATEHDLVFHEEDDAFYVGIGRERSEQMIMIQCGSAVTSENRFLPADEPDGEWTVVRMLSDSLLPQAAGKRGRVQRGAQREERETEVEYSAEHRGDHFFITMRTQATPNSQLLVAPVADPSSTTVLLEHRDDVKLESVVVAKNWLTVFERRNGLRTAVVYRLPEDGSSPTKLEGGQKLEFDEPVYDLNPGSQGDFDSDILRLSYTSLTTPTTTLDHNLRTSNRVTKKVQPVLGGFKRDNYQTERLWATSQDGTKVPVSVVYRKDLVKKDGSDPMLLDAYGAYEISNDVYFSGNRLSLLDRGFMFAIAHVRGGGDLGRLWYENGKYLKKKNTFTDLIACAEHLIQQKYTSTSKLAIEGRSAGGLTMGATVNLRPDLFSAVIMGVPFVDCLTTMLDESIPLTTIEFEEWGNPMNKEYYDYMLTYSPVDNICSTSSQYPNILVSAGLHDPRVGYWEPAKFVAKLRGQKTDSNLLLFKCEMGAGHFSQSGRFDRLKEVAMEYAFLLKVQDLLQRQPAGAEATHS